MGWFSNDVEMAVLSRHLQRAEEQLQQERENRIREAERFYDQKIALTVAAGDKERECSELRTLLAQLLNQPQAPLRVFDVTQNDGKCTQVRGHHFAKAGDKEYKICRLELVANKTVVREVAFFANVVSIVEVP